MSQLKHKHLYNNQKLRDVHIDRSFNDILSVLWWGVRCPGLHIVRIRIYTIAEKLKTSITSAFIRVHLRLIIRIMIIMSWILVDFWQMNENNDVNS